VLTLSDLRVKDYLLNFSDLGIHVIYISAATGDRVQLSNEISSSSNRKPLIKNVGALLAISDEEFSKYSPTERSNLVVRFANPLGHADQPPAPDVQ
jgi:hypothetical protein